MGFPILVRWHLFIESAPWYRIVLQKQINQQIMLNVTNTVMPPCYRSMHYQQFIIFFMILQNRNQIKNPLLTAVYTHNKHMNNM